MVEEIFFGGVVMMEESPKFWVKQSVLGHYLVMQRDSQQPILARYIRKENAEKHVKDCIASNKAISQRKEPPLLMYMMENKNPTT